MKKWIVYISIPLSFRCGGIKTESFSQHNPDREYVWNQLVLIRSELKQKQFVTLLASTKPKTFDDSLHAVYCDKRWPKTRFSIFYSKIKKKFVTSPARKKSISQTQSTATTEKRQRQNHQTRNGLRNWRRIPTDLCKTTWIKLRSSNEMISRWDVC